jgi:3-dehydroquinate synthetase
VLADPQVLATLPQEELRAGLAEVVKAGLIADAQLFDLCAGGWGQVQSQWEEAVRRAMAVKVRVVQEDPYDRGNRAKLNLGHTIGHALETASGFQLRHGEAVSIGMVIEAQLAESIGVAKPGLSQTIARTLHGLGLPTRLPPGIDRRAIVEATGSDKKRAGGRARFTFPEQICTVRVGVEIDNLEELLGRIS